MSQFIWHLLGPHFQDGIMPTLDVPTIPGIQVIPRKNYTALKREVQGLIKDGKLKFEESNGPVGAEDLFEAKAETTRQEKKTSREIGSWKVAIRRDEVSISKVERGEAEGSSTTKKSKE